VPDNAVVVGVPGRVISYDGAANYVEHMDYAQYAGSAQCQTVETSP
jgi:serine acetyltransferase